MTETSKHLKAMIEVVENLVFQMLALFLFFIQFTKVFKRYSSIRELNKCKAKERHQREKEGQKRRTP
jgi:hypothetical protein